MAPRRPHKDSGRQLVSVPESHGDAWLDLLSYISKSSSMPWRLVREILVKRLQAVPDMDRTEGFNELVKQYENDGREHIPDAEVRLVLMPVIREALPKQFRCPPWIPAEMPSPQTRGGSAHTNEGRHDPEGIMDNQDVTYDLAEDLARPPNPIDQLGELRRLYMATALFSEVDLWDLSSRANVAVQAVLDNLRQIDDKWLMPLITMFGLMKAREVSRAAVVAAIDEFLTDLGANQGSTGAHGPSTT